MRHVGRSLARLEDLALVTGRARFVGDVALGDELHLHLVRAPIGPGILKNVEVEGVADGPGVAAVVAAQDLGVMAPLPLRHHVSPEAALTALRQPILAREVVRYLGEPVVAVIATSLAAAQDAAEAVELTIEPSELSSQEDAAAIEALRFERLTGDVEAAFDRAAHVVRVEVAVSPLASSPLEARGCLAQWDGGRGLLRYWGTPNAGHWTREALAHVLGLPRSSVEVQPTYIGGGFGAKGVLGPEDVLACALARALDRTVRWREDPAEAPGPTRAGAVDATARAALDGEGVITAIDAELAIDQGAYLRPDALIQAELAAALLTGPYAFGATRVVAQCRLSTGAPRGAVRGCGRLEASFVRERLLDSIAAELALDPLELRRRHLPTPDRAPAIAGATIAGAAVRYRGTRCRAFIEQAVRRFDLVELARSLRERRADGELVGLGTALFVEPSGVGPFEVARVSVDRDGMVELVVGASDLGQGITTALAQIVADILGVDYEVVRVLAGRTDRIGFGGGTSLSRSTALAGTAAQYAAEALREKALGFASHVLGAPQHTLSVAAGVVSVADRRSGATITLGALARAMEPGAEGAGDACGLSCEAIVSTEAAVASHGLQAVVASVDPMTGLVRVRDVCIAYDVGNAINPQIVGEQLSGGVLHGLGHALTPSADRRPEHGRGSTSPALVLPSAAEMPTVRTLLTREEPNETVPLGINGVGNAGVNGLGAALAAAVDAALSAPGLVTSLPIDPQTIRRHLRTRRGRPAARSDQA